MTDNTAEFSEVLTGHYSLDTALLIPDYPYGFKLRCQLKVWLEYTPKRGVRYGMQTSNPKRPGMWNKPKYSTYARFGGAMVRNPDNGHVSWTGLTEYCDGSEAKEWSDKYRGGCHPDIVPLLDKWVAAKLAYDAAKLAKQTAE